MTQATSFVEESLNCAQTPQKLQIKLLIAVDEIYSNIIRYSGVEGADSLRIPAALLSAKSIEIEMADGMLTLDAATLADLTQQGGDLKLSIKQEKDPEGRPVFSLTASLNGKAVADFTGTVTVKLPYSLPVSSRGEDVVVALRTATAKTNLARWMS